MKLRPGMVLTVVLAMGTEGAGGLCRAEEKPITNAEFLADAITRAGCAFKAGEMVLKRGKAKEVQENARKLIVELEAFDQDLNPLGRRNKIPVLANQVDGRQRCKARLAGLRGASLDTEALKLFSEDLEGWIALSQRSAEGGNQAESQLAAR